MKLSSESTELRATVAAIAASHVPAVFRMLSRSGLALSGLTLAGGAFIASPAWADLYGYVDEQGQVRLANEKLDDRYSCSLKASRAPSFSFRRN